MTSEIVGARHDGRNASARTAPVSRQAIFNRQFENKRRSFARSVAVGGERAAQLFCGQRAIVQAVTVPVCLGGEAVGKNPGQVLGRYADAVIGDLNADGLFVVTPDAERDLPVFFLALA